MSYVEYDLNLADEDRRIRDAAHEFAAKVLRPAGRALDSLAPQEVVAPGSALYQVLRQASELGYTRMLAPVEMGGLGASPLTQHLVLEELAWGSLGLAAVCFLASFPAEAAFASGKQELIEEFALPYFRSGDGSLIGCWAITEPDHGSDTLAVVRPEMRVKGPGQVLARRDGDQWILNGQKSAWVSNAPIATHAVLNVHLDPRGGLERGGACIVPLNLPGICKGKPLDKHGVRSLPQGEIFFDDVRVPRRYLLVEEEEYCAMVERTLTAFNAGVSCAATGLARASYECALAYCKERVQGGRRIFEHQSVRARLFRMFSLVQASRALSRQVFVYNHSQLRAGQPGRLEHSIAAKVFCTNAALEVATLAVQLHGGNGLSKEYEVEMFLRDATALTVADGENALLAQVAASAL